MSIALKLLGLGLFVAFIYFSVESMQTWIMAMGLPVLPDAVRYLGVKSGLFVAMNIYIKIVIYGFIVKQIIGYLRAL